MTVTLRSTEQNQLDSMLKVAIESYNTLANVEGEEAESFAEEFEDKASTLADIHLEIIESEGEVSFTDEEWQLVLSGVGHPDVVREEGQSRVDHLRTKLYWRALDEDDDLQSVPPFMK